MIQFIVQWHTSLNSKYHLIFSFISYWINSSKSKIAIISNVQPSPTSKTYTLIHVWKFPFSILHIFYFPNSKNHSIGWKWIPITINRKPFSPFVQFYFQIYGQISFSAISPLGLNITLIKTFHQLSFGIIAFKVIYFKSMIYYSL